MKKLILILAILIMPVALVSAEDCTYQDAFFYCYEVDTNQDYIVNELDSLQDYNIDGTINESDEAIFNSYLGCSWDSNIFFTHTNSVNITRTASLDELYETFQNMGTTYGIQRLAYQYPNGTCLRNIYEYSFNISHQMIKQEECNYILSSAIKVSKNGHLILDNCKLEINSSVSGQYDLIIDGGFTANYSTIVGSRLSNGGSYGYDFYTTNNSWVQFNLANSIIKDVGSADWTNQRGLTLNTNNVIFLNNTISRSSDAHLELNADGIVIEESRFIKEDGYSPMYNIYVRSKNNLFINSNISGSMYRDIALTNGGNITLLNTSHKKEIAFSGGGKLFKKWFIGIKTVNNLGNPLSGVNVTFKNVTGETTYSGLTNSSGHINQEVLEYISNGTTRMYQTNYTISTSKRSYLDTTKSINITKSEDLIISLYFPTGGCRGLCKANSIEIL